MDDQGDELSKWQTSKTGSKFHPVPSGFALFVAGLSLAAVLWIIGQLSDPSSLTGLQIGELIGATGDLVLGTAIAPQLRMARVR